MDIEGVLQRLRQAIEYLNDNGKALKQKEIAQLTGIRQPHVSSALNGDPKRLSEAFIQKFCNAYGDYVSEGWILTGEGTMKVSGKTMKPHYKATVAAGVLTGDISEVKEGDVEYEAIIKRFPRYDFTIDVEGHSMEPTYWDKDIVACRRIFNADDVKPGQAYVIATKEGAVLKRITSVGPFKIQVLSDNEEFRPYGIDRDSIIAIYEVVGSLHTPASSGPYEEHRKKMLVEFISKVTASRTGYRLEEMDLDMERLMRDIANGVYSNNK